MKKFSEFGIKPTTQGFTGEKIKIKKVLNKVISVKDYKILPSKYMEKGNGKCLHLQVQVDKSEHVIFTGSTALMDQIMRVSRDDFPFQTTIIEDNERFEFT